MLDIIVLSCQVIFNKILNEKMIHFMSEWSMITNYDEFEMIVRWFDKMH